MYNLNTILGLFEHIIGDENKLFSSSLWIRLRFMQIMSHMFSVSFNSVREAAKKSSFFNGPTTKRGGGLGPDH